MLAYFHISLWMVEPSQDVIAPDANPVAGYIAFGILLALIASAVLGVVYATALWYRSKEYSGTQSQTNARGTYYLGSLRWCYSWVLWMHEPGWVFNSYVRVWRCW